MIRFTAEGLNSAPQDVDPPRDNSAVQERLRALILEKDMVPEEKMNIVFNILLDRKAHFKKELLAKAGYSHPSSTGFLKIMSAMKDLGIADTTGKTVKFTDIVFPFAEEP